MKKALVNLFTDGTNEDWDYSKVLGAAALLIFLAISVYAYVVRGSEFDPVQWSIGVTTILAGAAGVSKVRDWTVPPAKDRDKS